MKTTIWYPSAPIDRARLDSWAPGDERSTVVADHPAPALQGIPKADLLCWSAEVRANLLRCFDGAVIGHRVSPVAWCARTDGRQWRACFAADSFVADQRGQRRES